MAFYWMNLPGDNNTHLILGMQNPSFPGAFFLELNPIFQGEPCVETTIPEGPWGLNHLWPGTASSQAAIGCCFHAGLTLKNCVLHSQDHKGIVVSRQVHPIECRVSLRSAGPSPRAVSGQGYPILGRARLVRCCMPGWSIVEKCREKKFGKLKKTRSGCQHGPGASCQLLGRLFQMFYFDCLALVAPGARPSTRRTHRKLLKRISFFYKSSFLLCH